jgi:hypothetical protein
VIRAQSRAVNEYDLENETHLRGLIGELLDPGSRSWTSRILRISPGGILLALGGVLVWRMKRGWQNGSVDTRNGEVRSRSK